MFLFKKFSFLFVMMALFAIMPLSYPADTFDFTICADNYLEQLTEQQEFSGCVLIALNDQILLRKGYGFARQDIENTPDTRFCIGSITKSFTAMLILQLAQEDKLDLDDPVQKYIPEFKHKDVTIHHLLTMTSGLPCDFWTPDDLITSKQPVIEHEWDSEYVINEAHNQESFERSCSIELLSNSGEKFEYSNLGYLLLQKIIESVDDYHSYETSLQERILNRLNMNSTFAASDDKHNTLLAKNYEIPVVFLQDGYGITLNYGLIHGAGSIVSTIDDIYTWSQCIKDRSLLEGNFAQKMIEPSSCERYACGLVVDQNDTGIFIKHNGQISYFSSCMTINQYNNDNKDSLSIIVLANKREVATNISEALRELFETGKQPIVDELSEVTENGIDNTIQGSYHQNDSASESITISIGKNNTLWAHIGVDHIRLLKYKESDCFGLNVLNLKIMFQRDLNDNIIGFSIVDKDDGEISKYVKEKHL